ncbi:MAG: acetyl-CoA carboxylase biotin carboxyl carrier protein subunit [Bacteroidales bacterium]|nr:acetyl-CoA carboxylase biotin carboxyl carrier protein subunit [Bacteroidales bacterium]
MAEKENTIPQAEELHTLAPTNDSTEFLVPDSGKKKLRVAEEGHEYKTYLTKKFLERKPWKAPDPLQVLSHIPGSVIEVFVKPGQKVKKGEKLMIYEAMKMMNIVSAPMDGIIKEVHAKEGEKLPKGALLVTFKKPAKK